MPASAPSSAHAWPARWFRSGWPPAASATARRVDLIGISRLHGPRPGAAEPYEVRLRIAARTQDRAAAQAVGFETSAMHVNGPAGGGGSSDPVVREVLAVASVLLPRNLVRPEMRLEER